MLGIESRFDNRNVMFIKNLLQNYLDEKLRNMIVDELFNKYIPLSEAAFAKELYMSYDQIKLMKKQGMFFGIHGYDHYWLGKLDKEHIQTDVMKALDFFNGVIDKNNWVICYPYGSHNTDVVDFIAINGCKLGFTTEVRGANLKEDNKLLLPRLDTNDFPPKSENYKKY